jgi:hypothetical protein
MQKSVEKKLVRKCFNPTILKAEKILRKMIDRLRRKCYFLNFDCSDKTSEQFQYI